MASLAIAPPPPPMPCGPRGRAWVIRNKNTLFGWHVPEGAETTHTQVVAFRKQQQAVAFCGLLGNFRNSHQAWPERVLEGGDSFPLLQRVSTVGDVHSGLGLEQVELDGNFVERLATHHLAMAVIEDITCDVMTSTVYSAFDLPLGVYQLTLDRLFRLS